jgi:hypothetical protein
VADVLALVVNIDKLLERLDNVEVVLEVDDDIFASGVQSVIEQSKGLRKVSAAIQLVTATTQWRPSPTLRSGRSKGCAGCLACPVGGILDNPLQ